VAEAFTQLGFPDYFRVELAWAKLLGVVLLLAPVPARLKEWGVLWGLSYFFWRRLELCPRGLRVRPAGAAMSHSNALSGSTVGDRRTGENL
jgi:DoxX-like family